MFRMFTMLFATAFIVLSVTGCKTGGKTNAAMESSLQQSDNSNYLVEAAGRAKKYIGELIRERNNFASANNLDIQFKVVDARDPRLYAPGAPIQPNTPAEKALIKYNSQGQWVLMAWIQDQPGFYRFKEPNGNRIIDIEYAVEKIAYGSRFDGNFGSVTRNTSGQGWYYIYYLRGLGNRVSPAEFDNAIATFLQNAVLYMTPL